MKEFKNMDWTDISDIYYLYAYDICEGEERFSNSEFFDFLIENTIKYVDNNSIKV